MNLVNFAKNQAESYIPENEVDGPVVFSGRSKSIFAAIQRSAKIRSLFNAGFYGCGQMTIAEIDSLIAANGIEVR